MAKRTLTLIKDTLKDGNFNNCACFDIWSDGSHSSYLGGTLHTLDEKFNQLTLFIGVYHLKNGTKADQIKKGSEKLLQRVGLSLGSIDFLVTDNGSNIVAALKDDISGKLLIKVMSPVF